MSIKLETLKGMAMEIEQEYHDGHDADAKQLERAYGKILFNAAIETAKAHGIDAAYSVVKGHLDCLDFYAGVENSTPRRRFRENPYMSIGIRNRIFALAQADAAESVGL